MGALHCTKRFLPFKSNFLYATQQDESNALNIDVRTKPGKANNGWATRNGVKNINCVIL